MPSNCLILCHPLLLLPSICHSMRVFSNKSALHIKWPKYWSFSFSFSPSNEYSELISFRIHWFDLLAVQGNSRVFSNITVQKHQFFSTQTSLQSNSHPFPVLSEGCRGSEPPSPPGPPGTGLSLLRSSRDPSEGLCTLQWTLGWTRGGITPAGRA